MVQVSELYASVTVHLLRIVFICDVGMPVVSNDE